MARMDDLEREVEQLKQKQKALIEQVNILVDQVNAERTGVSMFEIKTWEDPHLSYFVYKSVSVEVENSPDRYVARRAVMDRAAGAYDVPKSKVRERIQTLVDEGFLQSYDNRVRPSPDAEGVDPEDLFLSNVTRREELDTYRGVDDIDRLEE